MPVVACLTSVREPGPSSQAQMPVSSVTFQPTSNSQVCCPFIGPIWQSSLIGYWYSLLPWSYISGVWLGHDCGSRFVTLLNQICAKSNEGNVTVEPTAYTPDLNTLFVAFAVKYTSQSNMQIPTDLPTNAFFHSSCCKDGPAVQNAKITFSLMRTCRSYNIQHANRIDLMFFNLIDHNNKAYPT